MTKRLITEIITVRSLQELYNQIEAEIDSYLSQKDEYSEGYDDGFKAGIKEVVEWIIRNDIGDKSCIVIEDEAWVDQVKEWGVE